MRKDYLIKIMTEQKDIIGVACVTTGLVKEAADMHGTYPTATAALGRALTGCGLMASLLDPEQRVAIKLDGGGPLKGVFAEAEGTGAVRGYVAVPQVDLPPKNGKLDVSGALGTDGFLTVTKDLGFKDPYRGIVALYNGEIASDIAAYFTESEQIPSAVGLGVFVEKDGSVSAAGGFLVQTLPVASDEGRIDSVISRIEALESVTSLIREGKLPEDMLKDIFAGIPYHVIEERRLFYRCSCSRERIEQAIITLGPEEIRHIIEGREAVEITCQFCSKTYRFDREELTPMLEEMH
jgi:molecular chaperone Hsp33